MTALTVEDVFNVLDESRHLHGYRLEPAAAPFFTLFLPCVLEDRYHGEAGFSVVPEFPLWKGSTKSGYKADYFALGRDRKHAFLIELKTDMKSLDSKQDRRLQKAADKGIRDLIRDVKFLAKAREKLARQKYYHVLKALECLDLIRIDPELEGIMYAENSRGVYQKIDEIEIVCDNVFLKSSTSSPNNQMAERSSIFVSSQA